MKKLAWSVDRILCRCENDSHDKVQGQPMGVLALKAGALLVLKLTLDIMMDVDDSVLWLLIQNL